MDGTPRNNKILGEICLLRDFRRSRIAHHAKINPFAIRDRSRIPPLDARIIAAINICGTHRTSSHCGTMGLVNVSAENWLDRREAVELDLPWHNRNLAKASESRRLRVPIFSRGSNLFRTALSVALCAFRRFHALFRPFSTEVPESAFPAARFPVWETACLARRRPVGEVGGGGSRSGYAPSAASAFPSAPTETASRPLRSAPRANSIHMNCYMQQLQL